MTDWLDWPFFEPRHRKLAARIEAWCETHLGDVHADDVDAACRALVHNLGAAGLLDLCIAHGDIAPDVRSLAIARATLARHSGLADFAFAMQGLGSGAISLAGDAEQKADFLPGVAAGSAIAAFALTEPDSGSDVAAISTRAVRDGDAWVITGEKTYISNGTIADVITLFARTSDDGARGLSAFILPMPTRSPKGSSTRNGMSRSRKRSTWKPKSRPSAC